MKTIVKEPCPLSTTDSLDNPRNREVATALAMHQTTRMLFAVAHSTPKSFRAALKTLEAQINSYYELGET